HTDDVPSLFSDPMQHLGAQDLEGIDERPSFESRQNTLFPQHRFGDLYRACPGIHDGSRNRPDGLGSARPGSGRAVVLLLLIAIERRLKPFHGDLFPYWQTGATTPSQEMPTVIRYRIFSR